MRRRARANLSYGFTLVEVIVVVVILGIIAGVMAPRVLSPSSQQVRACAEKIADLLAVAARRQALSSQVCVVEFDARTSQVRLLVLTRASDEGGAPATWNTDRLAPPAEVVDAVIAKVEQDGGAMDPASWRLEFTPGVRRPNIAIVLTDAKGREPWRVEMPAAADQAAVSAGENGMLLDQSVDLDAAGAGSAAW